MSHRVLLLATENWPNSARYAEGFAAAGCDVLAFASRSASVRQSRFVTERFTYNPFAPVNSLRAALEVADADLIVSCDERGLTLLLRLYREKSEHPNCLSSVIERSLGEPESYSLILSRSTGLAAMREVGVRVPLTLPVDAEANLDTLLRETGLPAVLKADATCGGQGVAIATSSAQAHAAFRRLASPTRLRNFGRFARSRDLHRLIDALVPQTHKISVQRYVEGRVAASAFAAHKGRVVAGFAYEVLDAHKNGLGPPKSIRRIDSPEIDAATRAVAERFGLTGAHGLDFILDSSGAAHLIEINPRATRGGTLPFGLGRDIPFGLASILGTKPEGMRKSLPTDVIDFDAQESVAPSRRTVGAAIPRLSAR